MNPKRLKGYGLGCILMDSLLLIDLAIRMYTGKTTWVELVMLIVLSVLIVIPVVVLIRKNRRKGK